MKRDNKYREVFIGLKNNPTTGDVTWATENLVRADVAFTKGHWRSIFELVEGSENIDRDLKLRFRNALLKLGVDFLKDVR